MSQGLNFLAKGFTIQDATNDVRANVVALPSGLSIYSTNVLMTGSVLMGLKSATSTWEPFFMDSLDNYLPVTLPRYSNVIGGDSPESGMCLAAWNEVTFFQKIYGTQNHELFVYNNLGKIADVAVNVNGGNRDAGTQTVTLADDDKAVTALEIIDDWDDGSDRCQVDIAAQTLTAVKISKDTSANATGNRIWVTGNIDQIGGNAINVNGGNRDTGTQTVTLADNDPAVASLGIMDDWDSGDTCKTTKSAITTSTPAGTTGTAVAAGATLVLAAIEIIDYTNWSVWVKNAGGGNGGDLTDVDIQVSPDNSTWVSLTWTAADDLTSGNMGVYSVAGNSYRYVRCYATAAADPNDTTVDAFITCNNG